MATSKSTLKRQRTSEEKRIRNKAKKSEIFKVEKGFRASVLAGETEKAKDQLLKACSLLDKSAKVGMIHKNKVSRKKSQLMSLAKASEKKA
ncbi:MAG: 30S ribosomal protein S20 [Lentisphaerae bacterium GWF2_45_14]|nr:MAG: 30S ribosomal protein S20 [Lentisphaerae bacterium GWF2_45_14]